MTDRIETCSVYRATIPLSLLVRLVYILTYNVELHVALCKNACKQVITYVCTSRELNRRFGKQLFSTALQLGDLRPHKLPQFAVEIMGIHSDLIKDFGKIGHSLK